MRTMASWPSLDTRKDGPVEAGVAVAAGGVLGVGGWEGFACGVAASAAARKRAFTEAPGNVQRHPG
jgi:hypothetical protein